MTPTRKAKGSADDRPFCRNHQGLNEERSRHEAATDCKSLNFSLIRHLWKEEAPEECIARLQYDHPSIPVYKWANNLIVKQRYTNRRLVEIVTAAHQIVKGNQKASERAIFQTPTIRNESGRANRRQRHRKRGNNNPRAAESLTHALRS